MERISGAAVSNEEPESERTGSEIETISGRALVNNFFFEREKVFVYLCGHEVDDILDGCGEYDLV